jgi:Ca2+-binding RTX toxin-like protein
LAQVVRAGTRTDLLRQEGDPGSLIGTEGDDVLVGTTANNTIASLGGGDRICSLEGDDFFTGGPGNDRIDGGPRNDRKRRNGEEARCWDSGESED